MLLKHSTRQVKDLDEKQGVVVAYANSYGNVDSDRQMSMPGSYKKTVQEHFKKIRVFKDHDRWTVLGVPTEIDATDPNGLLTTTRFNMQKEVSRDMFTDIQLMMEHGQDADMSVGVIPVKTEQDGDHEKVYEWKLKEYSFLSSWGANEMATVQQIKSQKSPKEILSLIEKAYDMDYSDTRLKQIEALLLSAAESTDDGAASKHSDPLTILYNQIVKS